MWLLFLFCFFIEFCEAEKAGIVFVKMEKDEEKKLFLIRLENESRLGGEAAYFFPRSQLRQNINSLF